MHVKEFVHAASRTLAEAAESHEPIQITKYNRAYVGLVGAPRLEQMQSAEDIVQGLLRLAQRDADCSEYQSYAEALRDMADAGHLSIATPDEEAPVSP